MIKISRLSNLLKLILFIPIFNNNFLIQKFSFANELIPSDPITVSVMDVLDRSNSFNNDKNWSKRISNILVNELTSTGHFSIIESDKDIIASLEKNNSSNGNQSEGDIVLNKPKYLIYASLNDFVEISSSGGGAGVGFFGFTKGTSSGNLTYYISFDLKVVNTKTGIISYSRTIEGEATADIKGNNFSYTSLAGLSLDKEDVEITGMNPTRVIRKAIQEISSYLDCVLYLKDQCLVQFEAKDLRRIKSNEDLDMF